MSLTQTVTWIPCAERLPDWKGQWHPCAFTSGDVRECMYQRDGWWKNGDNLARYITHWALPLTHPAQLQAEREK